MDIFERISQIDWKEFETAYGRVGNLNDDYSNVPKSLTELFSGDISIAKKAAHKLWCGLCHQYSYISTAALPAYDILKYGLLTLTDELKIELLDIFNGFAVCSVYGRPSEPWQNELREKMLRDISMFQALTFHSDEDINYFSNSIVENLQ